MDAPHLVFTTVATEELAAELARELVEQGLAACVNILPGVRSIYRWKGEICDDPELLLVIKTSRVADLEKALAELHPYELPEVVAVRPDRVEEKYAAWILESCSADRGDA